MSYIQLQSMEKKKKKRTILTGGPDISIYLSGLWKNPFLFLKEGKQTTDKTEDYFYLFLYFLRHFDTKVVTKI